jgi:single-strand DNA-binding protein
MILSGLVRLGRDANLRHLSDGTPVLNMALAYSWGQKDGGGNRMTQWLDAALFGKRAESLAPHLTKGTAVDVVLDDVRIDEWTRQDGTPGKPKLVGRVVLLEFAGRANGERGAAQAPMQAPAAAPAHEDPAAYDIPF